MSENEPPHPPEDEIDLADLAAVLHRRRWLIVGITVVVFLLGIVYTFTLPQKFEYRSLIEVGQYQKQGTNDYQFVESPKASAGRLEAIAETIYQKKAEQAEPEGLNFSLSGFQVSSADNGGVLEINLEALKKAEVKDFFRTISSRLIHNHDRTFEVQEQNIEQKIQSIEADLQRLKQKAESDKRRLKLVGQEEEFLKNQIQDSTDRLDDLLQTKAQANIDSSQEPVGLLLFSSEIQRVRTYVDELRNRVLSRLPEKRENLRVDLESTQSQITTTEAKLDSQKVALANINRTHVLLEPTVSNNPVSPKPKLNLALSLVLGLFLAVFGAFLYEFWANNRDRITRRE